MVTVMAETAVTSLAPHFLPPQKKRNPRELHKRSLWNLPQTRKSSIQTNRILIRTLKNSENPQELRLPQQKSLKPQRNLRNPKEILANREKKRAFTIQ
jgi:hypothetical protein